MGRDETSLTLPDVLKNYQICLADITERKRLEESCWRVKEASRSFYQISRMAYRCNVTAIGQCSLYQQDVIN